MQLDPGWHRVEQHPHRLSQDVERGEKNDDGEHERADWVGHAVLRFPPDQTRRQGHSDALNEVSKHMNERRLDAHRRPMAMAVAVTVTMTVAVMIMVMARVVRSRVVASQLTVAPLMLAFNALRSRMVMHSAVLPTSTMPMPMAVVMLMPMPMLMSMPVVVPAMPMPVVVPMIVLMKHFEHQEVHHEATSSRHKHDLPINVLRCDDAKHRLVAQHSSDQPDQEDRKQATQKLDPGPPKRHRRCRATLGHDDGHHAHRKRHQVAGKMRRVCHDGKRIGEVAAHNLP
mmetsp:Transcript_16368/g.52041  ORF Transcript_16368/g.52041 Transcript_16368/m.52041 type:complete len:285 (-) Transcript_16368:102-956(-)